VYWKRDLPVRRKVDVHECTGGSFMYEVRPVTEGGTGGVSVLLILHLSLLVFLCSPPELILPLLKM